MISDTVDYMICPPSPEIASRIFRLYERVYGDSQAFAARWEWEFMQHPSSREIMLLCAEMNGELVGVSARHPVTVRYKGAEIRAHTASNSMVAPETRGKGVVQELYHMAAEGGTLQLSKGTAPAMYEILKKVGYRDIVPNTFMIAYLRPCRILIQKLTGITPALKAFNTQEGDEMLPVRSIPENIDRLAAVDGIIKNADYLHWRYVDIPHRQYHIFVRNITGRPVSLIVIRLAGTIDREQRDEPAMALAFARKAALRVGASRMIAWCTSAKIRSCLEDIGFRDNRESPKCSYFCMDAKLNIEWNQFNLEHGDGDIDYL
jgi:hypothetical protein